MVVTIILSLVAIMAMFICVLKYPILKIGKYSFDTFYIPLFIIALIFLVFPLFDKEEFFNILSSDSSLNPLKILVLFVCVSIISILLDETGFFGYIATIFINKYKASQIKLFFILYALISILTIFTSNDIIILTFTPFIIHFSRKGNINPIPYLVMEFVAANTYSMLLSIGNPTNIYLSSIFNIEFIEYIRNMILPTIFVGLSSVGVLYLLFRKQLNEKIEVFDMEKVRLNNKPLCIISCVHLAFTIVLLAISNYIHIEMWLICLIFSASLSIIFILYSVFKKNYGYVKSAFKRVPYSLIPFILSMFTIIMALDSYEVFDKIYKAFSNLSSASFQPIIYLVSSTLSCNIVNNIPMTLAYGSILSNTANIKLVYSTIIGSNIGALFTPIGALAGIMWVRMLKESGVKYTFSMFVKNGMLITSILVIAASVSLLLI